jgi:hypothetical protein
MMCWHGGGYVLCIHQMSLSRLLTFNKYHSIQYPTLSRIAKDYLAIQGSAVPSERAFSGGGITGVPRRSSLKPTTFEALRLLKGAYRNGHVSAAIQAEMTVIPEWPNVEESGEGDKSFFDNT